MKRSYTIFAAGKYFIIKKLVESDDILPYVSIENTAKITQDKIDDLPPDYKMVFLFALSAIVDES